MGIIDTYRGKKIKDVQQISPDAFKVTFMDGSSGYANRDALEDRSMKTQAMGSVANNMRGQLPPQMPTTLPGKESLTTQMPMLKENPKDYETHDSKPEARWVKTKSGGEVSMLGGDQRDADNFEEQVKAFNDQLDMFKSSEMSEGATKEESIESANEIISAADPMLEKYFEQLRMGKP